MFQVNNNRKRKMRQKHHQHHQQQQQRQQQKRSQKMLQFMEILSYMVIIIGFMAIDQLSSLCVSAQKPLVERGQKPIGAYRIFPKTTFSCLGRPAGYYADIETGCQIYHMCDGLGRQFSYSCPNTTLFQQRMLICDHWYMVNCSKAESDYAANLLIGQRDKPFVPEEENQLRTPRPDLLDRPYAPDYSGESYRNQYKDNPQISNEISDSDGTDKQLLNEVNPPSPTRWHLPRKSNTGIRSPNTNLIRRNDIIEDNNGVDLGTSFSSNYNSSADFSAETSSSFVPTRSTTVKPIPTTILTTITTTIKSTTNSPISTTTQYIKPPSRLYEPPFLYPIYNLNYTETEDQESSTISTTIPTTTTTTFTTTTAPTTTTTQQTTTVTTTNEPSTTRPTIFSGKPFTQSFGTTFTSSPSTFSTSAASTTTTTENYENFISRSQINRSTSKPKSFVTQPQTNFKYTTTSEKPSDIPTPFLDLLPPAVDRLSAPEPFKSKSDRVSNELPVLPSKILLPPFQEFVQHDVATTQGPPIYFEWKIPSNALEPPKFDPPPGVEGDNQQQSKDDIISAGSTAIAENYTTASPFAHNPFLASIINNHDNQQSAQNSIKTPTVRSIPKVVTTSEPIHHFSNRRHNKDNDDNATARTDESLVTAEASHPKEIDIQQLQKDYFIPDFLFPLETDARIGYEHSDVVNSFQLKIPERRDGSSNINSNKWYGENPNCPECHPSFVKPGTCEPCVRR